MDADAATLQRCADRYAALSQTLGGFDGETTRPIRTERAAAPPAQQPEPAPRHRANAGG